MKTEEMLADFRRDGFVVVPPMTSPEIWDALHRELPSVLAEEGPQRFFEDDGKTVRAVYGLHRKEGPWRALAQSSPLAGLARLLLGEEMYVYQWKINPKAARLGERWEWHRDFDFWQVADGMPKPAALTAAVFLDEITPENGPLRLIPGSHTLSAQHKPSAAHPERADGDWSWIVSTRLSHAIPEATAQEMARTHGVRHATGPAGTVVLFHSNLVHSSSPNRSPHTRTLGLITYNPTSNAPVAPTGLRPDFFVNHDPSPVPMA